jgi:hypothetical protein
MGMVALMCALQPGISIGIIRSPCDVYATFLKHQLDNGGLRLASAVADWNLQKNYLRPFELDIYCAIFLLLLLGFKMNARGLVMTLIVTAFIMVASTLYYYEMVLHLSSAMKPVEGDSNDIFLSKTRSYLEWYCSLPLIGASYSLTILTAAAYLYEIARRNFGKISGNVVVIHVVLPCAILAVSAIAFSLLSIWKVALWVFFVAVAFPPLLALSRSDGTGDRSILRIYARGLSQLQNLIFPKRSGITHHAAGNGESN